MAINAKQLDPSFGEFYKEFMSTMFPTLTKITPKWGSNSGEYSYTEKDGTKMINVPKKTTLNASNFPSKVKAEYKNKADNEIGIFWDLSTYNEKHGGLQKIRGSVEYGVYNPDNLYAEIFINVEKEQTDLSNWFKNGAVLDGISYKDAKTKKDLDVLSQYTFTNISNAFNGMSEVTSMPDLELAKNVSITSFEGTFQGCVKLTSAPNIITQQYPSNYTSVFKGDAEIKDLSNFSMLNCKQATDAFNGCASLSTPPDVSVFTATKMSRMFLGCASLPETFPYTIDLSSISNLNDVMNMFEYSSVKHLTVKYTGTSVPAYICPAILGSELKTITVVNGAGETIATRTSADNMQEFDYLTPGTYQFVAPKGATKMKAALVSGARYHVYTGGDDVDRVGATITISSVTDSKGNTVAASENNGITEKYLDWTGSVETHGGLPALFDAKWEDTTHGKLYSSGCGAKRQYTQMTYGWGYINNTYVQKEFDVVPGEVYTVTVAEGGTDRYCSVGNNRTPNGFVLLKVSE